MNTPHKAEVEWLGGSGISEGYRNADGSWRFEGMTRVYRQDMAAFIHRLNTPHKAEVEWLGGSGISEGYRNADGSWRFEGMTRVYRQDMAAFIHRLNACLD